MEMREEKLYSAGKAAKLLGIHFNTIKKWIYAGRLYGMRSNKAKKVVENVKRAIS